MQAESLAVVRQEHGSGPFHDGFAALAVAATLLLAPAAAVAGAGESGSAGKSDAVSLESIPGSAIKRVTLTAKAAERLGIETGQVGEETIIHKQMVGGRVVPPVKDPPKPMLSSAGVADFGQVQTAQPVAESAKPPVDGEAWVLVTLSHGEWDRLRKDLPSRILPLAMRNGSAGEVLAQPSGVPPQQDLKRTMLTLYYKVPGKDHGLTLYHRVRVELPLSGTGEKRRVVPYSAVYYDAEGTAWAYVNPKPLIFERRRIVVERIDGDLAVLTDGPPVGTKVVTVGAALLYGAEVVFGR